MNIVKYECMKQNIETVSYTQQELREFIKQCWDEREKLCKFMADYEMYKIKPNHVKNGGEWYKGLTLAVSKINRLKGIAVRKERELKFSGVN